MEVTKHTDGMQVTIDRNASGRVCVDVTGGIITLNTIIASRGRCIQVDYEPDFVPPWDDAPDWAWYRAQNKNGRWLWYEKYPTCQYVPGTDFWSSAGRCQMSVLCAPNPNWQDTLQQRPKPPEPDHKPLCPFCGSPYELRVVRYGDTTMFSGTCKGCGIGIPEQTSREHLARFLNRRAD